MTVLDIFFVVVADVSDNKQTKYYSAWFFFLFSVLCIIKNQHKKKIMSLTVGVRLTTMCSWSYFKYVSYPLKYVYVYLDCVPYLTQRKIVLKYINSWYFLEYYFHVIEMDKEKKTQKNITIKFYRIVFQNRMFNNLFLKIRKVLLKSYF